MPDQMIQIGSDELSEELKKAQENNGELSLVLKGKQEFDQFGNPVALASIVVNGKQFEVVASIIKNGNKYSAEIGGEISFDFGTNAVLIGGTINVYQLDDIAIFADDRTKIEFHTQFRHQDRWMVNFGYLQEQGVRKFHVDFEWRII